MYTETKAFSLKNILNRYFIKGINGMSLGFFCTLIVGLIIKQIGTLIGGDIGNYIVQISVLATICTGAAIGIGVASALDAPKLVLLSSSAVGLLGANATGFINGTLIVEGVVKLSGPGELLGAFIAVVAGVEVGKLVSGKTKFDIILTPFVTLICGSIAGAIVGPPLSRVMFYLGELITVATGLQPFFMGIVISVTMGMILTLPISSAALSIILGLSGLPAGAATVGCATHMVGFAVASFRENRWEGVFAQGLGTSMLQMPNVVKNPLICLPPAIVSAILGPLATCVFYMENNSAGGGMGTSGFVGQIMTWQTMSPYTQGGELFIKILLLHFILPAVLTLVISEFMRRKGYIKYGDMKLDTK